MRSFWAALPTEGRWLLSTVAIQTLGRGLTLPFTLIYLHEVRGFDLGLSGTLMALIAIVGLLVTGPGGALTDRYGARAILITGISAMIVGNVVLAFATTPLVAGIALVLIGFNFGVSWPAFNALIAAVVSGDLRQQYFGINFALVNLGIGVGGIVGGIFADVDRPGTFTAIFLGDAISGLVPMALLLGPLRHVHGRATAPDDGDEAPAVCYLSILRQPAVRWLTALTFVAMFIGYGQLEAGLPGFARQAAEVSTRTVGLAFAVNTAVIVLLQFTVLNRISGRLRTRVMVVMAVIWAGAWGLLGLAGAVPGGAVAVAGVLGFMAVFALGETLLQPTVPAMSNDLAADHTRGRYNAISAAAFQAGAIAGPVVAGFLLDHDLWSAYVVLMVVGCVAIAAMALVLERHVPETANGRSPEAPAEVAS
ncbi:MFS family permease [Nocardioides aromaticivorans]|uniref:MFS family permease n=1 Tax=Nocardioides aromaticivorans TaxID=200618 RepID=A0A7Y9ZLJ9_9ACTN|nr:MFS transporter [Nocardioides aromaticivorans]NYI47712.1 MFS family permease [Nocardioides aromaticivorans]